MQQMQKYMPLIFLVLYIALPAGVGVYFIVSSLFRVGQQEWMYKHDPTIVGAIQELTKRKHAEALSPSVDAGDTGGNRKAGPGSRDAASGKGFLARMREASESSTRPAAGGTQRPTGTSGSRRGATNGAKPSVSQNGSKSAASAKRSSQQQASRSTGSGGGTKSQPRSRDKRPRKGR
jgi:YidC/Oxa1 family membrane protein insertase